MFFDPAPEQETTNPVAEAEDSTPSSPRADAATIKLATSTATPAAAPELAPTFASDPSPEPVPAPTPEPAPEPAPPEPAMLSAEDLAGAKLEATTRRRASRLKSDADAATVEVIARGFPTRLTDKDHLLLGLTLDAMRDFTRTHPRGPNSHICPGFCRKWDEPGRSERGWTKGSDELPRATGVAALDTRCAQCSGPLDAADARGCPGCAWYLCGACARSPATNGYENQEVIIALATPKRKSAAELMLADPATAAGVGPARYFVSWFLGQKLDELFEALEAFMAREQLEPATTFFWVCDYVIRQGGVDQTVPALFTHVIRDIGRTLVFADPWDDPGPLRRAWCLWEILFGSEGALELILSTAQAARFRDALETDFASIQTKVCAVDLRNSDTRNPDDKRMIFEEVEKQIGMSELDARVHARLEERESEVK